MKHIALSSELYQIKTSELQVLPVEETSEQSQKTDEIVVMLSETGADKLISGSEKVKSSTEEFLPVRLAYASYPVYQAFLIDLIKPIKRKFYKIFPHHLILYYNTVDVCTKELSGGYTISSFGTSILFI